jgi:hypothetical protein
LGENCVYWWADWNVRKEFVKMLSFQWPLGLFRRFYRASCPSHCINSSSSLYY